MSQGKETKSVQLHVMHSWGGGLERWVKDFCRTDRKSINLVLKSIGMPGIPGQRLYLYKDIDDGEPIRKWDITYPIYSTAITNNDYRYALDEIIKFFDVEVIIVSSFIGHSLDILNTGINTIIVCHDYYPFCPAINIYFNQICTECSFSHLQKCFQQNQHNHFFPKASASEWIPIRKIFVENIIGDSIPLVVPSNSVKNHLIKLEPALGKARFVEISHGSKLISSNIKIERKNTDTNKLRIIILGRLAFHKGIELLKETYEEIIEFADIYLLGCGEEGNYFQEMNGINIVAKHYDLDDLPNYIEEISPDLGMLLSIWPETFCYTLSELMILGIPILATKVGSFEERIQDGINGFLVAPDKKSITEKIKQLFQQRELLFDVSSNLKYHSHKNNGEMVDEYHKLLPVATPSGHRNFRESNLLQMTQAELQRMSTKAAQSQIQLSQIQAQLQQAQMQLQQATIRIAAMETSKFWKFRTIWFKVKRAIKLPGEE